jgi:N-methylhydantoinase A/oxoprolinase/acetone carboxylase beta subunit
MPVVIVPPRAGVLSAVGLLCSPVQRDLVRSWPTPGDHAGLEGALAELARQAAATVPGGSGPGVEVTTTVDCRYAGQSHELTAAGPAAFPDEHRRRNGFARPGVPVEVVALRARAVRPAPLEVTDLPAPPQRRSAVGPVVVAEADCTIWVADGWRADPGPVGALILTRARA